MRIPMRLLVAAALFLGMASGEAAAQSVVVRHVPPGEAIELFLNATKVATAAAEANRDATLPLNLRENNAGKTEIDANIFIDTCDKVRRVIIVERGQPAASQEPGCERREISGLYWVRHVNTLVVDLGGANPTMMLVKGSYDPNKTKNWTPTPSGLIVFGGAGRADLRDAVLISCGDAPTCSGHDAGWSFTAGFDVWMTPWLAAEASYFMPPNGTASGSGTNYSFNSTLDPHVIIVGARGGIPIGPVRISGLLGATWQDSTLKTHETINGISQDFLVETRGWGWVSGPALEVWTSPWLAIYGEAGFGKLKGTSTTGGEVRFDDRLRYFIVGGRVKIGKK
jgi:hypothetical protein